MHSRHISRGLAVVGALALFAIAGSRFVPTAPVAPAPEPVGPPAVAPVEMATVAGNAADSSVLPWLETLSHKMTQYDRELTAVKKEVAHYKQLVSQPQQTAKTMPARRRALAPAKEQGEDVRSEADPTEAGGVREEQPTDAHVYNDFYAGHLDAEPEDLAWRAQVQTALEQRLEELLAAQVLDGAMLTSTDCRTTMCRIVLSFDDEVTRQRWGGHAAFVLPWAGQTYFHPHETEPHSMILYLARAGTALPLPEALAAQ